ncbi:hypothetical protein RRG08_017998 [Elysia crispata]|uniref:Uncharacterized protein n=1 Tax=Elysia crispata TaxID=231223 RepID=A0AAE0ZE57_9GAST|nr:hypothetical protein RRG08_017998 [Elysia crispata]
MLPTDPNQANMRGPRSRWMFSKYQECLQRVDAYHTRAPVTGLSKLENKQLTACNGQVVADPTGAVDGGRLFVTD